VLAALVGAAGSVGAQVGSYGYFRVTPDPRLCPAPTCGGFHLQTVNQPSTTCADGSQQASCYVASADFGALDAPPSFAPGEVVVRGRIASDVYPGFGDLGRLVAESAWTGATPQAAEGTFFRIRDLGIVCVTAPCFSIEGRVLNRTESLALSRLDLGAVDATPAQLEAAQAAVQRGDLLVAGTTAPDPGPGGEGLALVASQFWLPEAARPRCLSDAECSSGARCNAAEVCLPLPECEPGDPCPAVCSGYCEAAACTSNAECDVTQYCASDGLCRSDGACRLEVDCSLPGNDYPHIACVGHGICEAGGTGGGACGWECTNPMCVDLFGYDFGPCDALLGWGVVGGACALVSGCDRGPFTLFASPDECTAACLPAHEIPALRLPGALGLGLGLCALAAAWLRHRKRTVPRRNDSEGARP
jgi:hypothetical protein